MYSILTKNNLFDGWSDIDVTVELLDDQVIFEPRHSAAQVDDQGFIRVEEPA